MGCTSSVKYNDKKYNFKNVLHISLILDQLLKFMKKEDIKHLLFCTKKLNQLYCRYYGSQCKKLKIKDNDHCIIFKRISNNYTNINELFLENISKIENFELIYNLHNLKTIYLDGYNINNDIFKNLKIKVLKLLRIKLN